MNFDDLSDSDNESEVPFAQRAARKAFGKTTERKGKDKTEDFHPEKSKQGRITKPFERRSERWEKGRN